MVLEILEERGNAEERRGLVALHRREDRLRVRAGEEHQEVPLGEAVEHDHHLPVDVEEGQKSDEHFLAGDEPRVDRSRDRLGCEHVPVREHHALGVAGGAAGIGQSGQVAVRVDADRWRARRIFRQ